MPVCHCRTHDEIVHVYTKLLKVLSVGYRDDNITFWSMASLFGYVDVNYPEGAFALPEIFDYFIALVSSDPGAIRELTPEEIDDSNDNDIQVTSRQFLFIVGSVLHFRSQQATHALRTFWFLLCFRGLAHSGVHLLHQIGLAPTSGTVSIHSKQIIEDFKLAIQIDCIIWFDNLRRTKHPFSIEPTPVDLTVIAQSLSKSHMPEYHDFYLDSIIRTIRPASLRVILDLVLHSDDVEVAPDGSFLKTATHLTVPLRDLDSEHFEFREVDLLPIRCGSFLGTLEVLRWLRDQGVWDQDYYVALTVDYDLWFRIMRMICTDSLRGALQTLGQKTILMLGPWHIFKKLSEGVWISFGNLVLQDVAMSVSDSHTPTISTKKATMPQIILVFVNIFIWSENGGTFDGASTISALARILTEELIPLVSGKKFCTWPPCTKKFF